MPRSHGRRTLPHALYRQSRRGSFPWIGRAVPASGGLLALGATVLGASALLNWRRGRQAERDNPPQGRFLSVRGVRLHVVERGKGEPLLLLHGNGSMVQALIGSGLVDEAAGRYRVIAIDRPGFGHSSRPRGAVWSAARQADLVQAALRQLGIPEAVVFGHSWGASAAMALALNHPASVKALVLASGYFYPTMRLDVLPMAMPAVPLVGDVLRYAVSPVVARLIWPALLRQLFAPAPVPRRFRRGFPKEMALRPWQLRAAAEDAACMIPDAVAQHRRYGALRMPVTIVAGAGDRLVDTAGQSARLHRELPHSRFVCVPDAGHMVHTSARAEVMRAIAAAAGAPASGR